MYFFFVASYPLPSTYSEHMFEQFVSQAQILVQAFASSIN